MIAPANPAEWVRRLAGFTERFRGRRVRLVVETAGRAGHVVADLPLLRAAYCGAHGQVEILLGDPGRDLRYPHAIWDVRSIELVDAAGEAEAALRVAYAGGTTSLVVPRAAGRAERIPAPARGVAA